MDDKLNPDAMPTKRIEEFLIQEDELFLGEPATLTLIHYHEGKPNLKWTEVYLVADPNRRLITGVPLHALERILELAKRRQR